MLRALQQDRQCAAEVQRVITRPRGTAEACCISSAACFSHLSMSASLFCLPSPPTKHKRHNFWCAQITALPDAERCLNHMLLMQLSNCICTAQIATFSCQEYGLGQMRTVLAMHVSGNNNLSHSSSKTVAGHILHTQKRLADTQTRHDTWHMVFNQVQHNDVLSVAQYDPHVKLKLSLQGSHSFTQK